MTVAAPWTTGTKADKTLSERRRAKAHPATVAAKPWQANLLARAGGARPWASNFGAYTPYGELSEPTQIQNRRTTDNGTTAQQRELHKETEREQDKP
jgi:hypothetical protein